MAEEQQAQQQYRRQDAIIKPEQDFRQYRGLTLENGMKVLLVHDPDTDKSAAAMEVNIGHMGDPEELPGLAHFCEHMLFLGTEKYPLENEYPKFLSEHSGSSNAYTSSDHTNYYFNVVPQQLAQALDRFAQFFLKPLFTESATEREVNAVDSEHAKNVANDAWRLAQLERSTSDPKHAYSKFGTGNLSTLMEIPKEKGIQVREELLKFHSKWYSSNLMTLAVLGQESLDELERLVVELFKDVANKNVPAPEWNEHPFGAEQLRVRGCVVPIKDIRKLNITFPIPDLRNDYKSKPERYVSHLLGHEGPGSLLSELKARGWVNSLYAGESSGAKGFAFFGVNIDLTEDGIQHTDDIVTLVFQYLNLLRSQEPQQWIFDELKGLAAVQFRFKDKERPESYVCDLATKLRYYPIEEVICGDYVHEEWRPDLIKSLLDLLTPQNIRIAVVGKKFESTTDATEKWYGTAYKLEKISDDELDVWNKAGLSDKFQLPPRNEFIPHQLDLVAREESNPVPILLRETKLSRVWYKQDTEFNLPKAVFYVEMFSPLAFLDPLRCSQVCLLSSLFHDALNEYTYAAHLADLSYHLNNTKYGLQLSIKGYNDKLSTLLRKIIEKLTDFTINPQRFDILKESYVRALHNFRAEQPYQHASYYTNVLMAERAWTKADLLGASEDLTCQSLQQFIPLLFSQLHLEFLVHGNVTQKEAVELADIVEEGLTARFSTKPLLPCQLIRDREFQLSDGSNWVYSTENAVHATHCTEMYLQCGLEDTRANMLLELTAQILREPCFNVLRTREQLGYIVFSGVRRMYGVQGLRFIVQSEKTPAFLDGRILAFLNTIEKTLREMPPAEFERHKTALAVQRQEKPKKLSHRALRYWSEITNGEFFFDREDVEVAELQRIEHSHLVDFFARHISQDAPQRRKISVHVVSSVAAPEKADAAVEAAAGDGRAEPRPVLDVAAFKSSLPLYPLVQPRPVSGLSAAARAKL